MSDEIINDSVVAPEGSSPESVKEEYVKVKAFEEVSRDMHKYKQRLKDAEAKANEYEAQLKAQEEAKLQEQDNWKALFEKREAELQEARRIAQDKDQKFTEATKRAALKQELGGKVKDAYLSHANLSNISITDDGSIDSESLHEVANQFRKEHGQLIPQSETPNITGHAGSSERVTPGSEDLSKMTPDQLVKHYHNMKLNQ